VVLGPSKTKLKIILIQTSQAEKIIAERKQTEELSWRALAFQAVLAQVQIEMGRN
jgi:hypothetical protein